MIVTANRLRSIGWIALLLLCGVLLMVLAFRVNALRSQVHRAELHIVSLKQEKMYLETEFETRANQQQLKAWNDVEFGYVAPTAGQYLENERQLASLSMPAEPGAPKPISVASLDDTVAAQAVFPAMVSPLTGKSATDDTTAAGDAAPRSDDHARKADSSTSAKAAPKSDHAQATALLGEKLATLRSDGDAGSAKTSSKPAAKVAAKDSAKGASVTAGKKAASGAPMSKKTVEKVAANPSVKEGAKPKATVAKAENTKAGNTRAGSSKATKPIRLAMKDVKTKK